MTTRERLINYMKACFPGLGIQTTEEARAIAEVHAAAMDLNKGILTWSATEGMIKLLPAAKELEDTNDLSSACRIREEDSVYIFRDIHTWPFDRDPVLARQFRDLLAWAPTKGSTVVVIGAQITPHQTFEKMMTVMEFSLPDRADLTRIAQGIAKSAGKDIQITEEVLRALSGLSTTEAENALSLSFIECATFAPTIIYREKVQAVKKTGLLEIIEPDPRGLEAIGGLDVAKDWIEKRKLAYGPEAEAFGLPMPKGLMAVGVPGTGKSLLSKVIGTVLGMPTLKLDIGSMFNSLVGESEQRMRDTLRLAEAIAPCVVWIDEIDKGLAGSGGSGSGDSGVTRRIFGTLISWMQERRRPVFVIATANQVEGLPPELLRKGRFDEIFALDLPTDDERAQIVEIHLAKKGRSGLLGVASAGIGSPAGLMEFVRATDKFTGSEIENVVNEAMFTAFYRGPGSKLTVDDLLQAARATVPLAITAKEQIDAIRQWAQKRARFASTPKKEAINGNARKLSS
jgi:ATP-dependent 26S proteasome regulatory subunit